MNPEALRMALNGEYRDRGMTKWKPFASIPEQHIGLKKVFNQLDMVEKPLISSEQAENINRLLNEALHYEKSVYITYYTQGKCATELVLIKQVDTIQNLLFFVEQKSKQKKHISLLNLIDLNF